MQKKGLVATSPIYTGESILEERPIICSQFLWNAEYKYEACEFCLTPLETAEENVRRLAGDQTISLPYTEQCCTTSKSTQVICTCSVRYCSTECRGQAWALYHQTLCTANNASIAEPTSKLCDFWKSIHYPPETASIMLLVKVLASIKQSPTPQELISKINEFAGGIEDNDAIMRKLLGDKFSNQIVILRDMVGQIVFDKALENFFTDHGFVCLLSLISRHSQGIGTSPFSKWADNCERLVANNPGECERINKLVEALYDKMEEVTGLQFINSEGSGLYPVSFLVKHSCAPNAQIAFPHNNHILVVKATAPIEPGEEITICYLDECMQSRSRHSRVKYLLENYSLACQCPKCESQRDQPDETSDEEDNEDSEGEINSSGDEMNCD